MKIPPKYLAYGGVLAVGVIALLLDQAMPPQSASAAISASEQTTAVALATAAESYAPLDVGLAPLADRLAQLNARAEGATPIRDVFAVDRRVWGLEEGQAIAPQPTSFNPQTPLVLTAVFMNQQNAVAVVSGRVVRVGDFLPGGCVVQAIRPNSVVLDQDGQTLTLKIAGN